MSYFYLLGRSPMFFPDSIDWNRIDDTLCQLIRWFEGYEAYLVGSRAISLFYGRSCESDWDILVEGNSLPCLPGVYKINIFGGRHYPDLKMDVWNCPSVGQFLREVPWKHKGLAYHLISGAFVGTREFFSGEKGDVITRPVKILGR